MCAVLLRRPGRRNSLPNSVASEPPRARSRLGSMCCRASPRAQKFQSPPTITMERTGSSPRDTVAKNSFLSMTLSLGLEVKGTAG
eukprot:7137805-Pyramimonas_sp.AAC.1